MKDFTLQTYRELLLALQKAGYAFLTFEAWCDGKIASKVIILRHDVDLKAARSLATAKAEAELGIKATYYFRIVPSSNQPEVIRAIAALGHEIGYHYEDLTVKLGDVNQAIAHFEKQLTYFRQFYPVRTVCMHGSPASKYDNRNLWKNFSYRDYGIIGEPYFDFLSPQKMDEEVIYFTDTARMWDGGKYNIRDKVMDSGKLQAASGEQSGKKRRIHSTFDFIRWLETRPDVPLMMITTHPQRWTDKWSEWLVEWLLQSIKNKIKRGLLILRK